MSNRQQVFNPYLPSWEYVPDGEPHKFGDRIYVYGSHDKFGGSTFCMNDYVCWSAPETDLSDWRYEGVIYRKTQDPDNRSGRKSMYAPDVCQGPDGKYYLYYALDFVGKIGVAVCDKPAGKYEFIGFVHYPDGTILGRREGDPFQFDPGLYTEDGNIYLYTGFCPKGFPFSLTIGKRISREGAMVMTLEQDMLTIKKPMKFIAKSIYNSQGTPYEGHEFFEAPSMRKIGDKYYFIYSSYIGHELCYAISDRPDGDFTFGGTLVSIGDIGLRGIMGVKDAANYTGNTHGSIVGACGKYYVFYHRQTNRHCFSRQACAEEIVIKPDGHIEQAEVTSCGLNGGSLAGKGEYEARIACNLTSSAGGRFYGVFRGFEGAHPYFTQSGRDREGTPDQYIANIRNGTEAGFKYFDMTFTTGIALTVRGKAKGQLIVSFSPCGEPVSVIPVDINSKEWTKLPAASVRGGSVKTALYIRYEGTGRLDFRSFELT